MQTWQLLISNLPGHNPTLRMRSWRALKATGAAPLRDGVYVLPASPRWRQFFEQQAQEIRKAGGSAHLFTLASESEGQHAQLVALFDRSSDYGEVIGQLQAFRRQLAKLAEPEARQRLAGIGQRSPA